MRIPTEVTTGFRVMLIDALLDAGAAGQRERFFTTVELMASMLDVYIKNLPDGDMPYWSGYTTRLSILEDKLKEARGSGVRRFVAESRIPAAFCDVFAAASTCIKEDTQLPEVLLEILAERGIFRGTTSPFFYSPETADSKEKRLVGVIQRFN